MKTQLHGLESGQTLRCGPSRAPMGSHRGWDCLSSQPGMAPMALLPDPFLGSSGNSFLINHFPVHPWLRVCF